MTVALQITGLGKSFRHRSQDEARTFRQWVAGGFRKSRSGGRFWALRDVNFEVASGEMVGVIGHNGSGKSTLLRLLGGVMQADEGAATAAGPVNGLLELNTGMHPDLSGRENIVINGVLAGLLKNEIDDRAEAIIAFAELEEHIDQPVRTYSSGMKLRLGFAIAVHVDPTILLIDEVLAVGDLAFQHKCLNRIAEFKDNGCAIVLISHDLGQVRQMCDKVIWLDHGRVRAIGDPETVIASYETAMSAETAIRTRTDIADRVLPDGTVLKAGENRLGSQEASIRSVMLLDQTGRETARIAPGNPVTVRVELTAERPLPGAHVSVSFTDAEGRICFDVNTENDAVSLPAIAGDMAVTLDIDRLDLGPGAYLCSLGIWQKGWQYAYDLHLDAYPLEIVGGARLQGVLSPPRRWRISAGKGR